MEFVKTVSSSLTKDFSRKHILEVGSHDVNGSVRQFFHGNNYTGLDLSEGPGVDVVADAHTINYPDDSYDIAISCECFEHNPKWLETFVNMHRMTKKGGVIIFTCASKGRLEHGTSRTEPKHSPGTQFVGWDYYKNLSILDFTSRLDMDSMFQGFFFKYNRYDYGLYFVGIKSGRLPIFRFDLNALEEQCIRAITVVADEEHGWLKRCYMLIPLILSSFLPERQFQDFAFYYGRTRNWIKNRLIPRKLQL